MQVGAINNYSNYNNYNSVNFEGKKSRNKAHRDDKWQTLDEMNADIKTRQKLHKAFKTYALVGAGLLGAANMTQSCNDADDIDVYHKHVFKCECPVPTETVHDTVYLKEYVPGETIYKTDTIKEQIPVYLPGDTIHETDTILVPQIDTVYVNKTDTITLPGKNDTIYVYKTDTITLPGKNDTIYVDRPVVVHDTIFQTDTIIKEIPIYIPGDTVYVRPNFDSEVIDTLINHFTELGLDPGKGLPLNFRFYHEYETTVHNMLFNGKESSINTLVYDDTMTDWYKDKTYCRTKFSVSKGQGLIMQVENARNPHKKPANQLDWVPFKTFVFQKDKNGGLIKYEQQQDGTLKFIGNVTKDDWMDRSILDHTKLPNGETETWAYSDWRIQSHDIKMDELYNDYLKHLKEDEE